MCFLNQIFFSLLLLIIICCLCDMLRNGFFSVEMDGGELYEFMIVELVSCEVVVMIVGIVIVEASVNLPIICIIKSFKSSIRALESAWCSACSFDCCFSVISSCAVAAAWSSAYSVSCCALSMIRSCSLSLVHILSTMSLFCLSFFVILNLFIK